MCSKSKNIEIIIYDKADEVIKELSELLLKRYQLGLVTPMKGSDFIFGCVHLLYYQCHKINLNRGGPYKDSSHWTKI